jgi:hypothetical protein
MQNYNANGSTRHKLVMQRVQVSDPKLRSFAPMIVRFTSRTVRATRRANPVGALEQSVISPLFGRRPFATQAAVPLEHVAGSKVRASHHPEMGATCARRPARTYLTRTARDPALRTRT